MLNMKTQILDYVLVPLGLLIMVAYHLWLLRQIHRRPTTTIIGINAINRRLWVLAMMEETSKNGVLAVQTLRNNIMASTLLASTAITLCSIIAVLMTGGGRPIGEVDGFPIKFFSIFLCFLVSFLMNVQSIRYFSHASILINVPLSGGKNNLGVSDGHKLCVTAKYVWKTVNKGSYFWSLGLRAFYFSFPLFLWIFGPIPLFFCCVVMVFLLYFLDFTFEFGEKRTDVEADSCNYC